VQVSTGVIILHVADDNFIQPNRGMGAADHLVSGLVPIAILLVAAVVYRRLRAGARAATALLLGFFGVLTGSEAIYYTLAVGPSGDDYTGLMSILAGLVLLMLGVAVLWKSRRRADALAWRYTRRVLMTAGTAFVVMAILFPIALSYVVTHTLRADVPAADLGAAQQDIEFVTGDGLTLKGWYVPSKNGAAVIAFPGRGASQQQAKLLADHGYGVLLFDRRGEGDSEGDPNLFGWQGERDVLAAVDFLQKREDVDPNRIGAIGLSVGGEILIEAATETTALRAIVVEGASGRSVRDGLVNRDEPWWGLPSLAISSASTALFTNTLPPADLKGLVSRISPRAVFFVYGERGQPAERPANQGFYAAAGQPKAIWEVPDAKHMGAIDAQPREYEQRIIAFFEAQLPSRR
jgi:fermentation-respiration switch protein FrsA (DUF1100 family)